MTGRHAADVDADELARDARNRAARTFIQGLALDVAVAAAAVVVTYTSTAEAWQGWAALGISVARTVASTGASYVMRRFVDPSRLPTPLPPPVAGPPVDPDPEPIAGAAP